MPVGRPVDQLARPSRDRRPRTAAACVCSRASCRRPCRPGPAPRRRSRSARRRTRRPRPRAGRPPSCGCWAHVVLVHGALAGLEVDDHEPALVVALEPVDPAGEHGARAPRSTVERPARWRPAGAAVGRRSQRSSLSTMFSGLARSRGRPAAAESRRSSQQRVQHAWRAVPPRSTLASPASIGDRVHQVADALRGAGRRAPPTCVEQPAQLAPRERLHLRRRDAAPLAVVAHGRSSDSRRRPHQLVRVGAAGTGGGQPGEPVRRPRRRRSVVGAAPGRLTDRAAARRPAPAASAAAAPVPLDRPSASPAASGSSSSRNRDGTAPRARRSPR